jgi:hypothetical protein
MGIKKVIEREKKEYEFYEKKKLQYACTSCVWGKWQGKKHYCMMPKCMKVEKGK